jgi:hypothetical protein
MRNSPPFPMKASLAGYLIEEKIHMIAYPSFHGTNSIKMTNKSQPFPMKASLAGYLIEEKIHMIHILLL